MNKVNFNLSDLEWSLRGYLPLAWEFGESMEIGQDLAPDIGPFPAEIPASVQSVLLKNGVIPDWNHGDNYRLCEWVENRHWLFSTTIPAEWVLPEGSYHLRFHGLDYKGKIILNDRIVHEFKNGFIDFNIDVSGFLKEEDNRLDILFECPPRWMGQFGYTSRMTEWKPRFNYSWDWSRRLVQIGIYGESLLQRSTAPAGDLSVYTEFDLANQSGTVCLKPNVPGGSGSTLKLDLLDKENTVCSKILPIGEQSKWISVSGLDVLPWQPNGFGESRLYKLSVGLVAQDGSEIKLFSGKVGFKHIEWKSCAKSPVGADPWTCCVNGRDMFIQGVNWTPIRPNFADLKEEDYRLRLEAYREMGVNLLRVWGGGFLEVPCFYDLCDEMGILVWQEFPLCSAGMDNSPPSDKGSLAQLRSIAESYIRRVQPHVSLTVWCGGNELQVADDGSEGVGKPLSSSHPTLGMLGERVASLDPSRRYVPTSSSGPRFLANEKEFGAGVHWDVHGPWKLGDMSLEEWRQYWANDDALFRSELGVPAPSSVDLINKYRGDLDPLPIDSSNPAWTSSSWWIEAGEYADEKGSEATGLEEYVAWGQERQTRLLRIAVESCKNRFPECGGVVLWMGHDSWPCPANTSIIDFEGNPKPAASALKTVFCNGINEGP